ncbi:uncharacterized protein LOC131614568 [Vicia villosa]|uniref:uncharacterized protein LOC131614568 n=1 Tax=Vicia villosa TaxID=3911 RepID=UPI00273C6BD9|nr:uncharacterized protein LOC131614568 [Vicia villosa]
MEEVKLSKWASPYRILAPVNSVLPESNVIGHVSDNAGTYVPANNDRNANVNEGIDDVNMNVHDDVSVAHIEIPGGVVHNEEAPSNVSADKCINHTKDGQTEEKEPEKIQADKHSQKANEEEGKQVVAEDYQKKRAVAKPASVGPKKPWSKVVPKKRKARSIAENESDSDVVVDVLARDFKRLALETELAQNALEYEDIMHLIHEAGLMKTVTQLSKCYEVLVKEFIVNLHKDCGNKETKEYLKVFVRGKCGNFSPTVINKFLERANEAQPELEVSDNQMCKEITAGQVKTWPVKGKLTASKLSVKYDILHMIGGANSTQVNNFCYPSYSVKGPIAFPSLICGIILTQFPNILNDKDDVCKRASPLLFHHKLFQGTHVHDVVTTSAVPSKESTIMSKAAMISMLRETCKELESGKLALEKLISSLESNEGVKSADTDVEEQGGDNGGSDSDIDKEAGPDDGTDESVGLSSSESED